MLAGWPQRTKSYSNRYSHRAAALCYKKFTGEFCTPDNMLGDDDLALDDDGVDLAANSDLSRVMSVELNRWTKGEVETFLKTEFDIRRCSPVLVKFVHNKTGGIPAMCKALVRDHHLVFVKNGGHLDCSTIERLGDLALGFKETDINFPVPASIQSYFTKMMDSLNAFENSQFILITLKTATLICVGQEFQSLAFALDTLRACHPLYAQEEDDAWFNDEFDEAIEILCAEGFIREGEFEEQRPHFPRSGRSRNLNREDSAAGGASQHTKPSFYVFCSGFARDVIYNVMLFKQRSELHKQVTAVLAQYEDLMEDANLTVDQELRNALWRHSTLQL